MSLPRDTLLFSTVLLLWAVQIEASGYGQSGTIVLAGLAVGVIGLLGSVVATLRATDPAAGTDGSE